MLTLFLAVSLLARLIAAQDTVASVTAAFNNASIVPDVLSSFDPLFPLLVTFTDPSTGAQIPVTAGEMLTMTQTTNRPTFAIVSDNPAIMNVPYLIAMVDPDAPTPQTRTEAQVRHFLGADFVSTTLVNDTWPLMNNTPALSDFVNPQPPAGSDAHRYVILCFLQSTAGAISPPSDFNTSNILNFNISQFVDEVGGLTLVAGTFFKVAPDNTTADNSSSTTTSSGSSATTTPGNAAPQLGVAFMLQAIVLVSAVALLF